MCFFIIFVLSQNLKNREILRLRGLKFCCIPGNFGFGLLSGSLDFLRIRRFHCSEVSLKLFHFSLTQFRNIVINAVPIDSNKFLNVLTFIVVAVYFFFGRCRLSRNSGIVFAGPR